MVGEVGKTEPVNQLTASLLAKVATVDLKKDHESSWKTDVICLNRKDQFVDSEKNGIGPWRFLLDMISSLFSPVNLIVVLVVFYADIPVSIPWRCVLASFLYYQQIDSYQRLNRAKSRFESAYVDQIHPDLEESEANTVVADNGKGAMVPVRRKSQQITSAHRAGMKMEDCAIECISAKVNPPDESNEDSSQPVTSECIVPLTFHLRITHRASGTKWHVWRQFSDFVYIRHAISLDLMASDSQDEIHASRNPSSSSIDGRDSGSSSGLVKPPKRGISKLLSSSSVGSNQGKPGIASAKPHSDLPTLPGPLTVPPSKSKDESVLSDYARRKEVQVWGWLLQMQEIPNLGNHPFFREFLGMAEYDASVIIPRNETEDLKSSGEKNGELAKPKTYVGTTLKTFRFLDESPALRRMYRSCRDTHGMPARGRNYLKDRKKINPGRAICELLLMEVYEVPAKWKADKVDHIAMYGKVKKRVDALRTLTDKPFIFVMNFQIPGDPPCSIVVYYALPADYKEQNKDLENIEGFSKLLERFIDMPRTEEERLATWGVGPLAGGGSSSGGGTVTADAGSKQRITPATATTRGSINDPELVATSDEESNSGPDHRHRSFLDAKNPSDSDDEGVQKVRSTKLDAEFMLHRKPENPPVKKSSMWNIFRSKVEPKTGASACSDDCFAAEDVSDVSLSNGDHAHGSSSSASPSEHTSKSTMPAGESNRSLVPEPPKAAPRPSSANMTAKQVPATTPVVAKQKSNWNMPSDITWPQPEDKGCFPQSDFRNKRFKLMPLMTEGPWVVLAAVKSQPALLGQKVVQRYFRGDNYMEIDVCVGSSIIASQIVGICRGYGKHFTCNIGVMIQGEDESELPERMLFVMTQNKIDLDARLQLLEEDD